MTREESEYINKILTLGCIICRLEHECFTPPEVHHIIEGGKRKGHLFSIPLCVPHHRGNSDGSRHPYISRHPYKARFEGSYGTEAELLDHVRGLLQDDRH